jgi:hypothetical protein
MDDPGRPRETPEETSDKIAESLFGVTDALSRRRMIRRCALGAVWTAFLVPLIFLCGNYELIGAWEIGPLGWGVTVFYAALQLLAAAGLYFRPRAEFHTPVKSRADWADRAGAFWLVSCAFGPFLGWIVTSGTVPITATSWQWLYGLRTFLAAGIPLLLAMPLTRYIRGKSSLVALPLLLIITLLPVLTATRVSLDLWKGPVTQRDKTGKPVLYLRYTDLQIPA